MQTIKVDSPKFKSETEEADWWYEHRNLLESEFMKMLSGMAQGASAETLPPIAAEDAALGLKQAHRMGLPVEVYLKKLFHEAVLAEEMKQVE